MKPMFFLIAILLFCFLVFLYPDLETAITAIDVGQPLKPLIATTPVLMLGGAFLVFIYLGVKDD